MVDLSAMWRRIANYFRAGRTRLLEQEIARLREENRALVNSILGIAGIPPVRIARRQMSAAATDERGTAARATIGFGERDEPRSGNRGVTSGDANSQVVPLRRRSWQQLGRAREIEDARAVRRERETDKENFPAPRNIVSRQ